MAIVEVGESGRAAAAALALTLANALTRESEFRGTAPLTQGSQAEN